MKKIAILLILGSVSLHGESLFDQLKRGLQEAQKLAKQLAAQKRDLEACRQDKKVFEITMRDKDEGHQALSREKKALEEQIKTLEKSIKELQAQLKKARTSAPRVPPAAPPAVRKQPTRTGPPPIPAGALTPSIPPAAAPPVTPTVSRPKTPPTQPGRGALLEEIRGRGGKPIKKPTTVRKPTTIVIPKKTMQEELAERLGRIRKVTGAEEKTNNEDNNDDWED